MAFEFRLPDIGEGVVEGEIVSWKIKAGDTLALDQPMVEVMTDKATVEIPSPRAGRVLTIDVAEGAICKVGQVMLTIDTGGATAAVARADAPGKAAPAHAAAAGNGSAHAVPALSVVPAAAPAGERGKALAAPATRKMARDLGIDLALVPATGDGGRVTPGDVRAYAATRSGVAGGAAATATAPAASQHPVAAAQQSWAPVTVARDAADERVPFRGVRKKIAENMSRSKHSAAHFTYVEEADLTDLVALRARARKRAEERGVKLSYLPFIIKAVVAGLKKYPIVNATLDEAAGEIVLRKRYHIGVATASDTGLIVPVVKDADRKSVFDIARELDELARKVREGKASRDDPDRLHLHHQLARPARRRAGHPDHQLPRGGHPRRAQDQAGPGGARRADRDPRARQLLHLARPPHRRRIRGRALPAARDRAALRPHAPLPGAGVAAWPPPLPRRTPPAPADRSARTIRGAVPEPGPDDPALGLRTVLDEKGMADPALVPPLGARRWLSIYAGMLTVRIMDERLFSMQRQGRIGFYGEARGQEAGGHRLGGGAG